MQIYPLVFFVIDARWQHCVFVSFFARWCWGDSHFLVSSIRRVFQLSFGLQNRRAVGVALMPFTCTVIQA